MCRDCPQPRDRVNAVLRELTSWVLLPLILYAIPVGTAVALGYIHL
jgi:hypothetical protein